MGAVANSPEARAGENIDRQLGDAGWIVQSLAFVLHTGNLRAGGRDGKTTAYDCWRFEDGSTEEAEPEKDGRAPGEFYLVKGDQNLAVPYTVTLKFGRPRCTAREVKSKGLPVLC